MTIIKHVYVVEVSMLNEHAVRKYISKRKVLKHTNKWVTLDAFGSQQSVPASCCFADKESAERECESLANELISKLVTLINRLREPTKAPDKVTGCITSDDYDL